MLKYDKIMNKNPDNQNFAFNRMDTGKKILYRTSAMKIPGGKKREEAFADLKKKIEERKTTVLKEKSINITTWWSVSIAATILILFGIMKLIPAVSLTKVEAERGTHSEYLLPDGSEVRLNADSRISFRQNQFGEERDITLEGEAFFNVTKQGSFKVITHKGIITVLGTTFNVYARDNSFKVTCYTGSVMVSGDMQSVTIEPGESAELSNKTLKVQKDSKLSYVKGWINGEFYFENTPLYLVFDEVERQFNVKFVTNIREERLYYTGGFSNKDLSEALESICLPMNLKYEIDTNKKISVSHKE